MSVKKEANGRRSVQVEVEVPGTPEQVWEAIATGPGVGAWFVPTEIDGRIGGAETTHFGGGMDSVDTITEWDAPHRFAAPRALGDRTRPPWPPNGLWRPAAAAHAWCAWCTASSPKPMIGTIN